MKSYWFCIVEVDVPEGGMPDNADSIMRSSIELAIKELHIDAKITDNHSGWGLNKFGSDMVLYESLNERYMVSKEDARRR